MRYYDLNKSHVRPPRIIISSARTAPRRRRRRDTNGLHALQRLTPVSQNTTTVAALFASPMKINRRVGGKKNHPSAATVFGLYATTTFAKAFSVENHCTAVDYRAHLPRFPLPTSSTRNNEWFFLFSASPRPFRTRYNSIILSAVGGCVRDGVWIENLKRSS